MSSPTPQFKSTLSLGAPKSLQMMTAAMKLKDACTLKKSYDQPRQHIKKQRHYFANKGPSSQSYGFMVLWTIKKSECQIIDAFEMWRWHSGKESTCQCRRCRRLRFSPWVGKIPWSRKCQHTPVFLPGESHGQSSLEGYSPWGCKELGRTACTQVSYIRIHK